jgi:hypothetical protein
MGTESTDSYLSSGLVQWHIVVILDWQCIASVDRHVAPSRQTVIFLPFPVFDYPSCDTVSTYPMLISLPFN